ncbi:MAG: nucleoside hydrolase [Pseudomonadota bacterium]
MSPRRIIIDTDPGRDDAVAILLALAAPEAVEVMALTTVAGNVSVAQATDNALKVLEFAGRTEIPVYRGATHALRHDFDAEPRHHGETGLGGTVLPEPRTRPQSRPAAEFLIETLRAEPPGTVTLVTIGPLTNIATVLAEAPDIAPRIAEIVIMGGAYFEVGSMTPTAEFNIYCDPEAAKAVFACGAPITVFPLDVTYRCLVTPARLAAFRALGTPIGPAVAGWTDFAGRGDLEKFGGRGAPLHDPCTIAYLIEPKLFQGRQINVEIETDSPLCRGMTVADWWGITDRPRNALFMGGVDADGFFELLTTRLAAL